MVQCMGDEKAWRRGLPKMSHVVWTRGVKGKRGHVYGGIESFCEREMTRQEWATGNRGFAFNIPTLGRNMNEMNIIVIQTRTLNKSDSDSYTRRGIIICDDKELVTAAVSNSKLGSGDTLVELALGATRALMFAKEIGLSARSQYVKAASLNDSRPRLLRRLGRVQSWVVWVKNAAANNQVAWAWADANGRESLENPCRSVCWCFLGLGSKFEFEKIVVVLVLVVVIGSWKWEE
ncbi:hypothetical protein FCV25MIE_13681 [Fagus crenata]